MCFILDQDSDSQPTRRATRQKSKRGTKAAKNNPKTFDCDCGKSYTTEAALKTHINTKHQDKEPTNTTNTASQLQTNGSTDKKLTKVAYYLQQ